MSVSEEETIVSGTFRAANLVGIANDSNLNTTFFSGNLSSPNISALSMKLSGITYDENLKTLIEGNRVGAPDIFRYDAVTPFIPVVGSDGVIEVGNRIDFHRVTNEEDYTVGLQVAGLNRLSIRHNNTAYAGDIELGTVFLKNLSGICQLQSNQHSNIMWYNTGGTLIWIMDAVSPNERWSTTRDNALAAFTRTTGMTYTADPALTTFSNNISAPNLTGISYNNNFLLQSTDYTTATVISNHLHVDLTSITYKSLMGMRAYKGDLTTGQEMMLQVGKNHTAAISFVYKHNDTQANCEYRIDHPGRVAYRCYYGSTKTEHEVRGNLKVFGTITENASKTITHYTQYEGELQPGFFVESTGQVFHNGQPSYENCMVTVKQATTFSNNIIGVCVEVMNEEITDEYGNVNQLAGKFCRIATHGDCLIKCVSDTYHLVDIIIPSSSGGYGKKGSSMEIIDCMTHMVPRLKITSLETDEIDPECVVGFISI